MNSWTHCDTLTTDMAAHGCWVLKLAQRFYGIINMFLGLAVFKWRCSTAFYRRDFSIYSVFCDKPPSLSISDGIDDHSGSCHDPQLVKARSMKWSLMTKARRQPTKSFVLRHAMDLVELGHCGCIALANLIKRKLG